MPSVTITAKTGPDRQVTGLVINEVDTVELDLAGKIVRVASPKGISEYDLTGVTVITDTITGGNHVIVIS